MTDLFADEFLRGYVQGKSVCTLDDVRRALANAGYEATGPQVSWMLRQIGFRRDGWDGIGYDRSPRYVWGAAGSGDR